MSDEYMFGKDSENSHKEKKIEVENLPIGLVTKENKNALGI
jgi:hypothetical protein